MSQSVYVRLMTEIDYKGVMKEYVAFLGANLIPLALTLDPMEVL